MSASTQTVSSLNAFFKQVYAEEVSQLVPEHEVILKSIPFVSSEKRNGGDYIQPVILSRDHGVTYHGSNDNNLKLNEPIAAIIDSANIKASAMTMRSFLSYTAASRAVEGPRAFVDSTGYVVKSLTESFSAIIEQTHWYGGMGLAAIGTTSVGTTPGTNNVLTNTNQIVIDAAEFAPAVWVGGEGMLISIYNTSTGALLLNTEVTSVDITNTTLTLATVTGITNGVGVTIYRKGAKGLESLGLQYMLQNTGSLFGIDAASKKLWQANTYAVGSTFLNFPAVAKAVAIAYGRGLIGKCTLYVNSKTFSNLFPDFNTLKDTGSNFKSRTFPDSQDVANLVHGTKSVKFYVNSVEVDVVASDYVKAGYAMLIAEEVFKRVGSTEQTFDIPGSQEGVYFRDVSEYAALELRAFSDQALFWDKPARNIYFTGIVN